MTASAVAVLRRWRWGDALVLALAGVLVASSFALVYAPGWYRMGSFAPGAGPTHLVITQAGAASQMVPLTASRRLQVSGVAGITEIEIEPGRARCLRSPGRQGICEGAGWLERPGDIAVSLPNRLVLQVQGANPIFDSMHY